MLWLYLRNHSKTSDPDISGQETLLKNLIIKPLRAFIRNDEGVTLVEYGIALALCLLLGVAALTTLGGEIGDSLKAAGSEMPN